MKTHEILTLDEAQLVPRLRDLKLKELERHAEKIIVQQQFSSYQEVMARLIKLTPSLHGQDRPIEQVQNLLKELDAQGEECGMTEAVQQRLAVILMLIVSKKFLKILKSQ